MPFGQFLANMKSESGHEYYLTTQYDDEEPSRIPAPLSSDLQKDLTLQPDIMRSLLMQQMNLWMGKSANGSSSGLHHDHQVGLSVLFAT